LSQVNEQSNVSRPGNYSYIGNREVHETSQPVEYIMERLSVFQKINKWRWGYSWFREQRTRVCDCL